MLNHACSFFSSKEKKINNRFLKLFFFLCCSCRWIANLCVFSIGISGVVSVDYVELFYHVFIYFFFSGFLPSFLFAPRVIFLSPALDSFFLFDLSSFQRFCRLCVCMKEIHLDSYYSVVCLLSSTNRSINPCGFLSTPKVECEDLSLLLFRYFSQILEIKERNQN